MRSWEEKTWIAVGEREKWLGVESDWGVLPWRAFIEEMNKMYVNNVEISWVVFLFLQHSSVDFGVNRVIEMIKLIWLSLYGLYKILSVK